MAHIEWSDDARRVARELGEVPGLYDAACAVAAEAGHPAYVSGVNVRQAWWRVAPAALRERVTQERNDDAEARAEATIPGRI